MFQCEDYYEDDFEEEEEFGKNRTRRNRKKYDTEKKSDGPQIHNVGKSHKQERKKSKQDLRKYY